MAKSKNNPPKINTQKPQPQAKQAPSVAATPRKTGLSDLQWNAIAVSGIILLVFLFLKVCTDNQFTNWDDPGYVKDNPLIKDASWEGIKNIFALSHPVMGNYHPITILTYALDYDKANLDPERYHIVSLLFHLLATGLVYCFVWLFCRKRIVAVITAALFGLHPMHVESVAWIAGRKDVVYGSFYIASCISYLYYIRRKNDAVKWLWYAATAVLYACSLLSKPVAVVLPVTLLLIDLFERRLFKEENKGLAAVNIAALTEKVPLLIMSLLAGYKSLQDQRVFGALNTQDVKFTGIERIGLGGYALATYLWKAVWPIKLLCFYPYPLKQNGHLPAFYYIYPIVTIALIAFVLWRYRKNKAVLFGVLFFLVNIVLLLQFIPVGGAIIADRYTYIPYIGLFFMLGWGIAYLLEHKDKNAIGKAALGGAAVYILVLGYMANERCKVWYDGMSLWRDEIEIEPVRAPNGYNNLGFFYFEKFNATADQAEKKRYRDSSYYLLSKAIELQPSFVNPYISLGELLRSSGQFQEAKGFYYKALKLDTGDMAANAYLGLSVIYSIGFMNTPPANTAGRQFFYDSAIFCYNKTLALKPYNPEAHSNYANFLDMSGQKEAAIKEYGASIAQNPDKYQPYINRGRALQRAKRYEEAIKDFNKSVQLEPKLGEVFYSRGNCYAEMGNTQAAQQDFKTAQQLGYNPQQR